MNEQDPVERFGGMLETFVRFSLKQDENAVVREAIRLFLEETQALREKIADLEMSLKGHKDIIGIRTEELSLACEQLSVGLRERDRAREVLTAALAKAGMMEHSLVSQLGEMEGERNRALADLDSRLQERVELHSELSRAIADAESYQAERDRLKAELAEAQAIAKSAWAERDALKAELARHTNVPEDEDWVFDVPDADTACVSEFRFRWLRIKLFYEKAIQERDAAQKALEVAKGALSRIRQMFGPEQDLHSASAREVACKVLIEVNESKE